MTASELPAWHVGASSRRRWPSKGLYISIGVIIISVSLSLIFYHPASRSISEFATSACHARLYTKPLNIVDNDKFQNLSHETDAAWQSLFTENSGFLYRQMPASDGSGVEEIHPYGISMFHQLHCLQMLRMQMQKLHEAAYGDVEAVKREDHVHEERHYLHCFDYLRQTILCAADDTIEPPTRYPHDDNDIVNGQGPRMCRDNSRIYEISRLSGPNIQLRRKLLAEGKSWPEPEGVVWPEPIDV